TPPPLTEVNDTSPPGVLTEKAKPLPPIKAEVPNTEAPPPSPPPIPPPVESAPSVLPPPDAPPPPLPDVAVPKPDFSSPRKEVTPVGAVLKQDPGEPPMIVPAGPVQVYQVRTKTETLPDIARRTLGASERAGEIVRLNPDLTTDSMLVLGMRVRLPAD